MRGRAQTRLKKITGGFDEGRGDYPAAELSQVGFDEDGRVVVVSGPLKDMAGTVKKIDLHKRTATVEVELLGRMVSINLGIEILQGESRGKW